MVQTLNVRQFFLSLLGLAVIGVVFVMAMWGPNNPTQAVGVTSAITGLIVLLPSIIRRIGDYNDDSTYAEEGGIAVSGVPAANVSQVAAQAQESIRAGEKSARQARRAVPNLNPLGPARKLP